MKQTEIISKPLHSKARGPQPPAQLVVLPAPAGVRRREPVDGSKLVGRDGQRAADEVAVGQRVAEAVRRDGHVARLPEARVHVGQVLGQEVDVVEHVAARRVLAAGAELRLRLNDQKQRDCNMYIWRRNFSSKSAKRPCPKFSIGLNLSKCYVDVAIVPSALRPHADARIVLIFS